jgi:hypothetical protein
MRYLKSAALFVAASVGVSTSALAGAGNVTTVVTPLSGAVTYSRSATNSLPALNTYIGYRVTIASALTNTNTINNVVFTGTISVADLDEVAEFVSSDGATCQTTANPPLAPSNARSISCPIGQLRAGQTFPTFAVFFKAPAKDTVTPTISDSVAFSGTTYYAEGTGGVPQSTPQNSTVPWTTASVTLGTTNPTVVKSGVQKTGGTLFTGDGAVATATDPWTTTVVVPTGFTAPDGATYTSAEINETEGLPTCAGDLLTCNISQLTIPGTFAKLVITLRRDVSTIAKSAKISSAIVYYKKDATTAEIQVQPCTAPVFPALPQPGNPCINSRTEYTKKTAPTPDWIGDWGFEIFALDNGGYRN